jgi:hypothetical protein
MKLPAAKAELRCEATRPASQWRSCNFPENDPAFVNAYENRPKAYDRQGNKTKSVAEATKANSLRAATSSPGKTPQPAR